MSMYVIVIPNYHDTAPTDIKTAVQNIHVSLEDLTEKLYISVEQFITTLSETDYISATLTALTEEAETYFGTPPREYARSLGEKSDTYTFKFYKNEQKPIKNLPYQKHIYQR